MAVSNRFQSLLHLSCSLAGRNVVPKTLKYDEYVIPVTPPNPQKQINTKGIRWIDSLSPGSSSRCAGSSIFTERLELQYFCLLGWIPHSSGTTIRLADITAHSPINCSKCERSHSNHSSTAVTASNGVYYIDLLMICSLLAGRNVVFKTLMREDVRRYNLL